MQRGDVYFCLHLNTMEVIGISFVVPTTLKKYLNKSKAMKQCPGYSIIHIRHCEQFSYGLFPQEKNSSSANS